MRFLVAFAAIVIATPAAAELQTMCKPEQPDHISLDCLADYASARRDGYTVAFENPDDDEVLHTAWRWLDLRSKKPYPPPGYSVDAPAHAMAVTLRGRRIILFATHGPRRIKDFRYRAIDKSGRLLLDVHGFGIGIRGDQVIVLGERGYRQARLRS